MAQGHETFYGTKTSPELAQLEAARKDTWAAYQSLPCTPGGSRPRSAPPRRRPRAQYQLDKAKGYR